jgi:hypothetical protein
MIKRTLGSDLAAQSAASPTVEAKPVIMTGATIAKLRRQIFTKACKLSVDGTAIVSARDPWGSARKRYAATFDAVKRMAAADRTLDKISRSQPTRNAFTGAGVTDLAVLYSNGLITVDWTTGAVKPVRRGFPIARPSGHVNGSSVTQADLAWRRANPD